MQLGLLEPKHDFARFLNAKYRTSFFFPQPDHKFFNFFQNRATKSFKKSLECCLPFLLMDI